jgi:predicted nucleic acid-binding protein
MTMTDRVVIDASVAISILVSEETSEAALAATKMWSRSATQLYVPSHFWVEVANVLVRRRGWNAEGAIAGLVVLDELVLRTIDLDRPTLLLALDRMGSSRLSAYDAMYLALAISLDATLATSDRRLAEAGGERAHHIGGIWPRRLSETPAAYMADPQSPWAHSAVVGAHIADLRRQARLP